MWRKGKPFALFGVNADFVATVESSMEISQKLKMDLPFDPAITFKNTAEGT